jgi:Mn2+/Fe2+ NRAMP family transporter
MYWTALVNGLTAPFLLIAILIVASDKKLMQGPPSSRLGWTVVAITIGRCSPQQWPCLLPRLPISLASVAKLCPVIPIPGMRAVAFVGR